MDISEKYDILFISPARDRVYDHGMSYGQGCISAYMYKKSGFTSRAFGGCVEDCADIIEKEVKSGKTHIVGFYCLQDTIFVARHLTRELKKMGATVIVGGPQAAAMNEEDIRRFGADFVSVGEGEISIDRLLHYLIKNDDKAENIKGIRYIDADGSYHDNGQPDLVEDLDEIGFFNMSWNLKPQTENSAMIFTMTGRGCPFSCAFCHEGTTKRVRLRSVENVMAEVDHYMQDSSYMPVVYFADDTFTMNTERLLKFCEELKKRNLIWHCESHAGTLAKHPELISVMVDSGLMTTQIGIESGNADVLKAYGKQTTPEMVIGIVKRFRECGCLRVEGNLILGGALETKETLEQSIELAEKLIEAGHLMIELNCLYYAPFPLTPMTKHPEQYEMELWDRPYDYIGDSMSLCVNRTKALSREEIQAGYDEFRRRIEAAYIRELAKVTYQEIYAYIKKVNGRPMPGGQWKSAMRKVPHVYMFIKNGMKYHSIFNPDAVPVRSISDLRYDGDALAVFDHRITGLEKRVLERANGSLTFKEMAAALDVPLNDIYRAYNSLRERLLIYMERY